MAAEARSRRRSRALQFYGHDEKQGGHGHRDDRRLLPPLNPTPASLVKSLLSLARAITAEPDKPIAFQKRNVASITRKVKVLLLLFEEVKEATEMVLPPSAMVCFGKLYVAMQQIKALLDDCRNDGNISKLLSVMEHEAVANEFLQITKDMASALDSLSLSLLDLSNDVKEQLQLLLKQASHAEIHLDPKEAELKQSILSVFDDFERKVAPDPVKLKKILDGLQISDARDCLKELQLLEEETEDRQQQELQQPVPITNLSSFIRYCRFLIFGIMAEDDCDETSTSSTSAATSGAELASLSDIYDTDQEGGVNQIDVPDDFICPISFDMMVDPVIVATGQTYDRASITRWIEEGHLTCPKSGSKLLHTTLIPNYALRSLICKWCEEHGIPFQTPVKKKKGSSSSAGILESSPVASEATKMSVAFLLKKLAESSSSNPSGSGGCCSVEIQRQVAYELRLMAKCGMDNRKCIGDAGVIPNILPLLSLSDPKTQENAVTVLLNLSIYDGNKTRIMEAGALDEIIDVLMFGRNMESRENAAATLFSLSVKDEYKMQIGNNRRALSGLVLLLGQDSSLRGQKDAATALYNIAVLHSNRPKVVMAGAVSTILGVLANEPYDVDGPVEDLLGLLSLLAGCAEGLGAIRKSDGIPKIFNVARMGSPRAKEHALAVLLPICKYGDEVVLKTLISLPAIFPSLVAVRNTGTPRAQRKASALLRMLQRQDTTGLDFHSSFITQQPLLPS